MVAQFVVIVVLILSVVVPSQASALKVAVAANFKPLLQQLKPQYEAQFATGLSLSSASTGVLYAQISHGAPFDVFLAADAARPKLLQQQDKIVAGSRHTYAVGQLVLWHQALTNTAHQPQPNQKLLSQWSGKIALANAKTAPYGLATKAVLQHLGLWTTKRSQWVTGSNIGQTHQFIASGNVQLGFVAHAQVKAQGHDNYWLLPQAWYPPLEQQAVILARSQNLEQAKRFLNWLLSAKIQQRIVSAGYAQQPTD